MVYNPGSHHMYSHTIPPRRHNCTQETFKRKMDKTLGSHENHNNSNNNRNKNNLDDKKLTVIIATKMMTITVAIMIPVEMNSLPHRGSHATTPTPPVPPTQQKKTHKKKVFPRPEPKPVPMAASASCPKAPALAPAPSPQTISQSRRYFPTILGPLHRPQVVGLLL